MKIKDKIKNYKSGYVCIVGKTNVGKSSFLNKILKEKISIVSNKFQTTRKKITGILNLIDAQIIFVDTPGFHSRENKLSDIMIKSINREIIRSDLILFMIDPNLNDLDFKLFDQINKFNKKKILLINKIDILNKEKINNINNIKDKFNKENFISVINISVIKNKNLEIVLEEIKKNLDYGPKYFEDEILTQTNERDLTCELIREKILKLINKEIPHGIFIENNIFKRRQDKKIFDLEFFVYCERESHKKILIGSNGSMIKKISTESRIEIEKFLNSKINLKLWIKVKKNWRNNDFYIKKFID